MHLGEPPHLSSRNITPIGMCSPPPKAQRKITKAFTLLFLAGKGFAMTFFFILIRIDKTLKRGFCGKGS